MQWHHCRSVHIVIHYMERSQCPIAHRQTQGNAYLYIGSRNMPAP